jgi:hypothetical protein
VKLDASCGRSLARRYITRGAPTPRGTDCEDRRTLPGRRKETGPSYDGPVLDDARLEMRLGTFLFRVSRQRFDVFDGLDFRL